MMVLKDNISERRIVLRKGSPYAVTGKLPLVIMNKSDSLPVNFALMGTRALKKRAIRAAGGCKGLDSGRKDYMLSFFSQGFRGYQGLIWSGGTRQVDANGLIDPMITDVPGVIARENSGCIALGTVPRTQMLTLQGDSRLVFDEWGTVPNPDMHGILVVQNGPDGELGWDGDVETYFSLMMNWKNHGGFAPLGLISWNGGDVTKAEIIRSAKLGWPTFLIKGSGRATDDLAQDAAFISASNVHVIDMENPAGLREQLVSCGFID